jgi:isoleucyl-tRNA synthetase
MATKQKYPEYTSLNMPAIEQEFLARWKEDETFKQSVEGRQGAKPFVFYEGPPSANGLPGIHHVISRTLKDLVCRYKTMKGFQVKRKAGWDTHGLPVELGVEKELGITKEDIGTRISVEEYNQKCREAVMRYTSDWENITEKMGYWVDMSDPYITYDTKYIETLWWCLKQLFDKDLLYKSVSIQPYSPAAGTGLSSHELNQPGTYKDVKDTTVVAMFRIPPGSLKGEKGLHLKLDGLISNAEAAWAGSSFRGTGADIYFLAWTTTPWTLPSNCGLTVGPNIDYALVKTFNPYTHQPCNVILAKALIHKYFKAEGEDGDFEGYAAAAGGFAVAGAGAQQGRGDTITRSTEDSPVAPSGGTASKGAIPWQILAEFKGHELEGIRYEQLLPFEANQKGLSGGDPFRVILGDFVTTEDGTGIVHTAPAFGADDFKVGQKAGLGIFTLVDRQGRFIDGMDNFEQGFHLSGRYVKNYRNDPDYKDADLDIALHLKASGHAFKVEKYEHTYPHCWRTDKPIIYYPLDAWFVRTTAAKERMIELNKTINWKPKSTGEGRFGNWLENMVDWNLSRSRYWGTPLPIWVSEDGREMKCIGSVKELEEEIAHANKSLGMNQFIHPTQLGNGEQERDSFSVEGHGIDLHKPWVDQIILATAAGQPMHREPDLIDVWFDSGAMPYAQLHYPFEHAEVIDNGLSRDEFPIGGKKYLDVGFPADFIAEGVDQTRGWFYTLHALGVLLFDSVAYKTVVSNGLVLDKNGAKMSKRLGNVVNPFETIEKYSADATRWYLITNASPWDSLRFDINGIGEVQRKFFGTLYNTYQFFALYANVDGFSFNEAYIPAGERQEIDRWILSSLNSLVGEVGAAMDDYEPTQAGRAIEYFLDEQLSNWYVRLCRRRFWKGEYEADKIAAYQTLYECLETLSLLIAPISPFFADWLFQNLNRITGRNNAESVHLADFPRAKTDMIDKDLEERMQLAQDISSLILSIRKKVNIKVRQPLQRVLIPVTNPGMEAQIRQVDELIRNEVNVKEIEYLTDTEGFIKKKIKPNFKMLGARLGGRMKAVAALITNLGQADIGRLEREGQIDLSYENDSITVLASEVDIIAEDVPGWSVANKDTLTVALDITLTPALEQEGLAREFINRIQKLRKDESYELTDRIIVSYESYRPLDLAIMGFQQYICAEILADNITSLPDLKGGHVVDLNDVHLNVLISKIS